MNDSKKEHQREYFADFQAVVKQFSSIPEIQVNWLD